MKKINIVNAMVANGYHLFDETVEQFAARFTLEQLQDFYKNFMNWL